MSEDSKKILENLRQENKHLRQLVHKLLVEKDVALNRRFQDTIMVKTTPSTPKQFEKLLKKSLNGGVKKIESVEQGKNYGFYRVFLQTGKKEEALKMKKDIGPHLKILRISSWLTQFCRARKHVLGFLATTLQRQGKDETFCVPKHFDRDMMIIQSKKGTESEKRESRQKLSYFDAMSRYKDLIPNHVLETALKKISLNERADHCLLLAKQAN